MQNPMPEKLTFGSKGKMTRMCVQYCCAFTDYTEQLTDLTLRKNKLMWKSENSIPLF